MGPGALLLPLLSSSQRFLGNATMSSEHPVPETRVLAVASHVVYGYVGNTMATFAMQSLGCEVAALNTVQFSNHLGYGQAKGTRATAQEITDLYQGLKDSYLDDFQMMLSGYLPGAASVEAVGTIARDLKYKSTMKPGSFFWVLDPVMGDNGKLYVAEDVVPAYKDLIKDADLILPNQFEAETLSGVKIVDMESLKQAITTLHEQYRIPAIDCFFSGTGDMFAALMLVRFREAVHNTDGLMQTAAWVSGDEVDATELPLAKATEKVLASMHEVLTRTKKQRDEELERYHSQVGARDTEADTKKLKLVTSKAAEVRLVRNLD